MTKNAKTTFITPKGVANWPKLNTPDTKFDPVGKYSCKLIWDGSDPDVQAFIAKLEAIQEEFFASEVARLKADKKAALAMELTKDQIIKIDRDSETGEETGKVIFMASLKAAGTRKDGSTWTQKPTIFSASGVKLANPPAVYSGTILKLSVEVEPFINQTSKKAALSIRLKAAQIIELVSGGERSFSSYGFEAEDGDEIEDGQAPAFGNESGGANDATGHDDL